MPFLLADDCILSNNAICTDYTKEAGATVIAVLVFLSYIIILNTVVPISLYVRSVILCCVVDLTV